MRGEQRTYGKLTDFVLVGSKGGETSWDQRYSQKYITQISSEQTTNLNLFKKKKSQVLPVKKLTGNVKEKTKHQHSNH